MDVNLPFKHCWAFEQEQAAEFYDTSWQLGRDEYDWICEVVEVTAIDPEYAGYVLH